MEKKTGFILMLMFSACIATAQRQTENYEYNRNGDEAMKDLDFTLAQAFYESGVSSSCDPYSIKQLTAIWQIDTSMRMLMNTVMERCLSCLVNNATQLSDTSSMNLLVMYYTEGIGTEPNKATADLWVQRLEEIRNPYPNPYQSPFPNHAGQSGNKPEREKVKMQFFTGYAATFEAPFGLTAGGVGRRVGWYLRFRSNLSFQDYSEVCDGIGNIAGGLNNALPKPLEVKRSNTLIGTGGIVIKAAPSFHISAGAGYCNRAVLYKFEKIGLVEANPQGTFWAKYNGETSFEGVALDLDGTLRIGKTCYGSLGCSMLNFKYLSANAGFGVFF